MRILLKISGESLSNKGKHSIDNDFLNELCENIKRLKSEGNEIIIVVGGGNIWRGREGVHMDRARADHMGMLATVINSLALADCLEKHDVDTRVQTAIEMRQIAEVYIRNKAIRHLEKGRVVIIACGVGTPFFTTDSAAALRACELNADLFLLAKNIDGVYDSDPKKNSEAKKYSKLSYLDVLKKELLVMDTNALCLCKDNNIKIYVFGLSDPSNICRVIKNPEMGTIIE